MADARLHVSVSGEQIRRAVAAQLADMISSGGVTEGRVALEVLYMLPMEFVSAYAELFHKALKMADSAGGVGDGELGKAPAGRGEDRGKRPMLGSGGGKRYKEHWVVKDDDALEVKNRLDKRLRAVARSLRVDMRSNGGGEGEASRTRCARCGRMMAADWKFCPNCGDYVR